eukprot:123957-Prorocentrum_minimum.AAC.1
MRRLHPGPDPNPRRMTESVSETVLKDTRGARRRGRYEPCGSVGSSTWGVECILAVIGTGGPVKRSSSSTSTGAQPEGARGGGEGVCGGAGGAGPGAHGRAARGPSGYSDQHRRLRRRRHQPALAPPARAHPPHERG